MTTPAVVDLMRNAFTTTFWLSLPMLAAGFAVGVLTSLAQILTSIQDASVSVVPRLAAFLGVLVLGMPWMLAKLMVYTTGLYGNFGRFAH